jgi:hypothetical protein
MNRDPTVATAILQDQKKVETDAGTEPPPDDASMSRKSGMRRKERDQHVQADALPGLESDESPDDLKQDTPGRPKSASSRQQTQPRQVVQSGNEETDTAKPSE